MALVRESEDSILPMRGMPAESTFEATSLPPQSFPATKYAMEEAAALKRGDWPPFSYWEDYKPIIRRLYIDENRTLQEVIEILENEFDLKASAKMYKSRFRIWGWRKNIRFDSDIDTGRVQEFINSRRPEDAGDLQAEKVLLANGQLVDIGRLHRHLRRKRRYKDMQLAIRINQPDIFYNSEAIFYSVRSHTLGRYQGKIKGVTDALDLFAREEPITGRWLRFTDEIKDLMQQQNLGEAIVQMRRAPEEVAAMVRTEPTALFVNLFMYILKLCDYPAITHAESRQVRLVVKSLFHYTASLLFSGSPGLQTSHPLQVIIKGLATAPDSDLSEIASRAWMVTCQSWAELVFLDSSSAVSKGSVIQWLEIGDQGVKDGMWFSRIIEGIIDGTMASCEAAYDKRDIRCIEALQSKAELIIYTNMAKRLDYHLDPRLEELYLQILNRGAQGARMADALKFLAESHRARGEWDMAETYARLCPAQMDSNGEKPSSVVLEEIPSTLPSKELQEDSKIRVNYHEPGSGESSSSENSISNRKR
ncbi:hypothetical protein N8I77_000098 [Diaporthe amygdali]|uniref:Clr5 domain-containing protein n=1 Tax=Phomopsis amygdali TaxID=1214568 RepID=A0AAD9W8R2_PHOAM|nr:hypothetical protein N8I77_000098 [Diaporthe amygdali]